MSEAKIPETIPEDPVQNPVPPEVAQKLQQSVQAKMQLLESIPLVENTSEEEKAKDLEKVREYLVNFTNVPGFPKPEDVLSASCVQSIDNTTFFVKINNQYEETTRNFESKHPALKGIYNNVIFLV